jgi:hypothetical protein
MDNSSLNFIIIKRSLLIIISLLFVVFITTEIFKLKNKTYSIKESELYKLDSIKLMDKAYLFRAGKNTSDRYEFVDKNDFPFIIDQSYNSIINKSQTYDTLQYSTTVLTVYTDKEGYENYSKGNKSTDIEVYQFAIGNKKYIDIEKLNNFKREVINELLIFFSIIYLILFIYIYRLEKFD